MPSPALRRSATTTSGPTSAKQAKPPHVARRKTAPAGPSASCSAQAQKTAGTGGSYRNANGNICFDEFNYFGGSECSSSPQIATSAG